ncbi:MAG: phosphatase PAP2 family protein [Polyangiaceae bacterium]
MKPSDDKILFEPRPRIWEFIGWVAVSAAAMALLYFALTPRNFAIMAAGGDVWKPETFFDRYIPFVHWMVWPYYAYFALLTSATIVESRHRLWLYEGAMGALAGAFVGFVFFYILPSRVEQPDIRHMEGFSYRALQLMFDMDRGFHAFPSMHVAFSVYTANFWRERMPRYWHVPGIVAVFVSASTVLCKRHYFIDVPSGIAVGLGMGWFARKVGPKVARALAFLR